MCAIKLTYDDFEDEITWLAIHSSLLNFRMAYFLNKYLKTNFRFVKEAIKSESENSSFEFMQYEFYEKKLDRYWKLVENKAFSTQNNSHNTEGMFDLESISVAHYIIPDNKKLDYILKIENIMTDHEVQSVIQKINNIPQVSMVYQMPTKIQKSKKNLLYKV